MSDRFTPEEVEFLVGEVDEAIDSQRARVVLEERELERLERMREKIRNGSLPESIPKVRAGMVTLDMMNETRR